MENSIYNGKVICCYDLKDHNGFYYEDMVIEWKQAAANRKLTCTECGSHVYLAAGPIKEPYFAHYDIQDCDYEVGSESEELKKGKRLLHQLLRRSFPDCLLQARYRMENGLYTTLLCQVAEGKSIAVDLRLQNNSLDKFQQRDGFYLVNEIIPLYVLGARQDKNTKQLDWYQNLIQKSMGYLIFINAMKEELTLKKCFSYRIGKTRKFISCHKTYPIKELLLAADGTMICDFTDECNKIEAKIHEEKDQYKILQDRINELRLNRLEMEAKEEERLEQYKQLKREEELKENIIAELNPAILEKCICMIEEGNAHLVSKKYYDAIMRLQTLEEHKKGL